MTEYPILSGAEPFYFEGGEIGVLVLHGFTGTPQSMFFLGHYLAEKGGLTVSGPRLKGHGTSPADMALSSAEDWVRSVEHAMQRLQARCRRLFVTGLSMGGTLALYLAATYPRTFAGVAPINGAVFLKNPGLAGLAFSLGLPETVPGVGSDIKQPGSVELAYPVIPVPAVRHLYALMGATRDLLPNIVCPLLAFQSREDHVVPPDNAPVILEGVSSVDKSLVWLENSYHVATLDNDREGIATRLLEFIKRLSA